MLVFRNISTGLGVGSLGAIVAILVSLPLESPDDIIFNAVSVGFAAIVIGGLSGVIWHWSKSDHAVRRQYIVGSIGLFVAAMAVAIGAQTQFDDAVVFTIPIALIATLVPIFGTPIAAKSNKFRIWNYWVLVLIAVVASIALAGQGDQESGSLSLPSPP
ncbi:hypothetical protein JYU04_00720 [Dehalococcoides mccartyi]|nr:hypothetical protein [Dehalococcoides mccartyi]